MVKIFLIRHGETDWNKLGRLQGNSDVKLSSAGIRQAQLLADNAPFQHVDAIYSSNLSRAIQTAEILAEHFNLRVQQIPDLRETNFGDWEGKSIRELAEKFPVDFGKFFTAPENCRPPHGETFFEAQARVMIALRKIISKHDNQNVLIVAHGSIIRLTIAAVLDMPINKLWAISQFNLAVNVLRVDEGNFTVELLNSTAHLR